MKNWTLNFHGIFETDWLYPKKAINYSSQEQFFIAFRFKPDVDCERVKAFLLDIEKALKSILIDSRLWFHLTGTSITGGINFLPSTKDKEFIQNLLKENLTFPDDLLLPEK